MRKALEFLCRSRPKTLRTSLYGDIQFSSFELELLHTPSFQRLYDLKQLGFADRVFPDAVHSRFNHVLGVVHRVQQMATHLGEWLDQQAGSHSPQPMIAYDSDKGLNAEWRPEDLRQDLREHLPSLRLIALLHDLTHAPYGHTLEDELGLFEEHHDDPERQVLFFDGLFLQLVWNWSALLGFRQGALDSLTLSRLRRLMIRGKRAAPIRAELDERFDYICKVLTQEELKVVAERLAELEFAFVALFYLGELPPATDKRTTPGLELTRQMNRVAGRMGRQPVAKFDPYKHAFLIDLVGNTICADLLDYARRDSYMAGLKPTFDDRVMRYLVLVSFSGLPSPDKTRREFVSDQPRIRVATQFYTNKMRHDVLSELSTILKARYLISESILLHPTKCAAGAMLGSALQLLGLRTLPEWILTYGDSELIEVLDRVGEALESFSSMLKTERLSSRSCARALPKPGTEIRRLVGMCVSEIASRPLTRSQLMSCQSDIAARANAARRILWLLRSRRMPTLSYRIRSGVQVAESFNSATVAIKYANPMERYKLERGIEKMADLPLGSVFVHCPARTTTLKVARALVVGKDLKRAVPLREVALLGSKGDLEPYQAEVNAIEEMYESIWKLHVFLDSAYADSAAVAAGIAAKLLNLPNDPLLEVEMVAGDRNEFDFLAEPKYRDEISFNELPVVIRQIRELLQEGQSVRLKVRRGTSLSEPESVVSEAIRLAKLEGAAVVEGRPARRRKGPTPGDDSDPTSRL